MQATKKEGEQQQNPDPAFSDLHRLGAQGIYRTYRPRHDYPDTWDWVEISPRFPLQATSGSICDFHESTLGTSCWRSTYVNCTLTTLRLLPGGMKFQQAWFFVKKLPLWGGFDDPIVYDLIALRKSLRDLFIFQRKMRAACVVAGGVFFSTVSFQYERPFFFKVWHTKQLSVREKSVLDLVMSFILKLVPVNLCFLTRKNKNQQKSKKRRKKRLSKTLKSFFFSPHWVYPRGSMTWPTPMPRYDSTDR